MNHPNRAVERIHREAPFTDVHCHPSLKAFLFRRNLWKHHSSGRKLNPFSSRSDFRMLEKGGVGVIWSALHLPEREFLRQCFLLRMAAAVLVPVYWKLMGGRLFRRLIEMMDEMEKEIGRKPDRIGLAKSVAEVERLRTEGKIAVIHTVEGAHVLEGDPDRLYTLAGRGVACITLTHFYWNGLVSQADAVPPEQTVKKICKFDFGADGKPPLTDLGRAMIDRMIDLHILIDVSHCTPEARKAVYQHVGDRAPILATHVGVTGNGDTAAMQFRDDPYNLSDADIQAIAATGGAIGVIFYNYWLSSKEPEKRKNGLDLIWNTMSHIHQVTGNWDHVMVGSDFDGLTDPPDDLRDASYFPALTRRLLEEGLSTNEVQKVLGGNALEVLRRGWK